jgi:hypothetical protein
MNEQTDTIRPHHGLCLFFFKGKGYSNDFINNMTYIKNKLEENPLVRIASQSDIICSKCPNLTAGICSTQEKVAEYDRQVLIRCGLSDGDILPFHSFRSLVLDNIINAGKREEVCGNCQWTSLCH